MRGGNDRDFRSITQVAQKLNASGHRRRRARDVAPGAPRRRESRTLESDRLGSSPDAVAGACSKSCTAIALRQPAATLAALSLVSNPGSAAGVGAESGAHPLAAEARCGLDVSVGMDELQERG